MMRLWIFFKKGESFSQIDNAISIADSLGFDITIYLIIGAPAETYNDAIESIQYPMKYKNIISSIVSKLMPIRGTSYYDYAIEQKLVGDETVCYPKHETIGLNKKNHSNNAVEEIWEALYPTVEKMSKFLTVRNHIKMRLSFLGVPNVGVKSLNMLTQMCLNPVMVMLIKSSIHIANLMKLNRILKRLVRRCPGMQFR